MKKIAVFDSGLGGLTVLKRIHDILPCEDIIYYGDSANAPYGPRTIEEIQHLSDECVKYLVSLGADTIVIACNTATSASLLYLKDKYPDLQFYGIRPDLSKAVNENPGKNILLMATKATCEGEYIKNLYNELSLKANISLLPAPGIVPLVEAGKIDSEELRDYLNTILEPYAKYTDAVILGCTHFPFVKNAIDCCLEKQITFYDAASSVAEAVYCDYIMDKLDNRNKIDPMEHHEGTIEFLNSSSDMLDREKKLFELYI